MDKIRLKSTAKTMEYVPFKMQLSFVPIIRYWESLVKEGSEAERLYAGSVLEDVDNVPAFRKPIKDHITFAKKHKPLVDKLMSAVFPKALELNEIKAVTPPFTFDLIAASSRFVKIIENNGGSLGLPYNMDPELLHYAKFVHICRTLLVKYYDRNITMETPFIFKMYDPETSLDMFYKMTINADFVDINAKRQLKEISEDDLDRMLENIDDVELWQQYLPPENFKINGFVICTLVNVTLDQVISKLKNNLLESDALLSQNQFEKIRHNVRSFFKIPDLRVGLGVFKEGEGIANFGHWSWRDVICKGQIKNIGKEFKQSIYQKVLESGQEMIVENINHLKNPTAIENAISQTCIESLIVAPLKYKNSIIGYLELGSCKAKNLNSLSMDRVNEILPLFSIAIQRSLEERENRIDAVIMEKYTAIHSSVQWKFKEVAQNYLNTKDSGHSEIEMEPIVFEDVYPLYGMADIRNSSEQRNQAIQADLISQLKLAQKIIVKVNSLKDFPILDEINFRIGKLILSIGKQLRSQDETRVYRLLATEVEPLFEYTDNEFPEVTRDITRYKKSLDPKLGVVYNHRKSYEQSVTRINAVLSEFLEEKEREAQKMYPHYFEKYKTDGIDYNIYLGKSLSRNGKYNSMCLANMRLWQLIMMAEMTRELEKLQPELPIPLKTAQLILVHDEPLSIRFRVDEKKFDVDGAYNMRYEIIKKRIDKALIKGTKERATQPGTVTVVYTNPEVNKEYLKYCEFLHHRNLIEKDVEQLTLEDTQGVTGLKALRIKIKMDQSEILHTREIEEIISNL